MRPHRLRRLYALMSSAPASPRQPRTFAAAFGAILFVTDGLTPGVAGELIAVTVMRQCPQFTPVLRKFVSAYSPSGVQRI